MGTKKAIIHPIVLGLTLIALLGKNLPNFEKVIVPGVAHMVSLEKPVEFDAAVRAFLKKVYGTVS
jgi:pimeloyl-ACP methyl ester carboxylesterase